MTLMDVIDLDEIVTVNSMWEIQIFEPWAKVGATLVWELWENQYKKIFEQKKPKLSNMMVPNFLYNNSYFF